MTPEQIDLVQASFAKVEPIASDAAAIFYARLFEIAPQTKAYFSTDMNKQGMKLMTTLGVVVKGLRNLDAIVPVAEKLAIKHIDYGVTPEDYEPVGAALLFALKTGLGDAFDAETEAAWITAYTTLSGVMIKAAYPAAAE